MEEETRQVIFETNGKTYKELYDNIIEENLRNPPPEGENTIEHHIRPRSISPDLIYSSENLVRLTEKDHLLVHYLLWQYYKRETDDRDSERKMCSAFWGMVHLIEWRGDTELEWIVDRYEELRVDFGRGMSGDNNPLRKYPDKNPMKRPEAMAKFMGNKNPMKRPEVRAKLSRKVLQYSLDGTFVAEYPSLTEAEIKTNSRVSGISRCCAGRQKTHNGFVWKYAESK